MEPERPKRKRRVIACQLCSHRKVRCGRESLLTPCANCQLACVECCPKLPQRQARKTEAFTPANIKRPSDTSQLSATPMHGVYLPYKKEEFLPNFIRPLSNDLDHYDRNYLSVKGVFTLPNSGFQTALLRAYIEHVHPLLPIIELEPFLKAVFAIHDESPSSQQEDGVSLLLYWAVVYAAISTVSSDEALYDVEAEPNRLILVQALLLVVHGQDITRTTKDARYWMAIIWSQMQTVGIDVEVMDGHQCSAVDQRTGMMYRRIWWSCFVCDRLIALAACVDPVLPQNTVPLLHLDDLEIFTSWHSALDELGSDILSNPGLSLDLGRLCVIQVQICLLFDEIISGSHGRSPRQLRSVSLDEAIIEVARLRHCTDKLLMYYNQLTRHEFQRDQGILGSSYEVPHRNLFHCHKTVLFITIDAILAFLLQRRIILEEKFCGIYESPHSQEGNALSIISDEYQLSYFPQQSRVSVTSRLCLRFIYLKKNHGLHKLRPVIVALLLPAAIDHLFRVQSVDQGMRDCKSTVYFNGCLSVLKSLEKDNPSVKKWTMYLQSACIGYADSCSLGRVALLKPMSSDLGTQQYPTPEMYTEPIQATMQWWFGDGIPI